VLRNVPILSDRFSATGRGLHISLECAITDPTTARNTRPLQVLGGLVRHVRFEDSLEPGTDVEVRIWGHFESLRSVSAVLDPGAYLNHYLIIEPHDACLRLPYDSVLFTEVTSVLLQTHVHADRIRSKGQSCK